MKNKTAKQSTYELITERIIAQLEAGTVPWHKPWRGSAGSAPMNITTKRAYRGINVMLLSMMGYDSPYWMTFNQAKKLGGKVRKGEKGSPIVFWKEIEKKDTPAGEKPQTYWMLRHFFVFNSSQIDGLELPELEVAEDDAPEFDVNELAAGIIDGMPNPPEIEHCDSRAYYRPSTDTVNMPKPEAFDIPANYYSTTFHELVHSTGHASRLSREGVTGDAYFGSHNYSKEELVAELGAAFLSATCGLGEMTFDQSAAYIAGWLKKLKSDSKFVIQAAGAAQRAADYILAV